jgi:tetratricopeptide (TPR) repeat protein
MTAQLVAASVNVSPTFGVTSLTPLFDASRFDDIGYHQVFDVTAQAGFAYLGRFGSGTDMTARARRSRPRHHINLLGGLALCALTLAFPMTAAAAQDAAAITIAGLGTISFPTSTRSAAAETTFVRGVLLLHLFEYDDALDAFRAAQRLDPGMVMAWWGEAMTFTHAVWDEQDSIAARAVLANLGATAAIREARAVTPRERGYLHAIDLLYGPGPKARRDTVYAAAMDTLVRQNPSDDETRAFYALALLGLSQGVRNVPTYLRAATIAEAIFARNPQHPGAAHYWIHAMDDPDHAAEALPAARALAGIGPDADHAQHMTSHIFMALGMWDDVVRANENAMRVVNATSTTTHGRPTYCGHYNAWLEYGYLQEGRTAPALALVDGCISQATQQNASTLDPDDSRLGSATEMWSRYIIDTEGWRDTLTRWAPDRRDADPVTITWAFTRALAAAGRHDTATVRGAAAAFHRARARLVTRLRASDPEEVEYLKRLDVLDLELQAERQLLVMPAQTDSAIALLERATAAEDAMAYAFGPPMVEKPSHELLAEVLLADGRPVDAEREFTAALRRMPRRVADVQGVARAKAAAARH